MKLSVSTRKLCLHEAVEAGEGENRVVSKAEEDYNPKAKGMSWNKCSTYLALLAVLLLLSALLSQGQSVAGTSAPPPDELYSCINDGFSQQLTTYKDFAYQKPAR